MVRLAGASTRNRNRQISNKYRLKVVHGDIVADPDDLTDEDGEKSRYTNLVAGVDAEDANEHHLQEVLASSQNGSGGVSSLKAPQLIAFIPTPDSTGVIENYSDFYAPNQWRDPITYLYTSLTPEEACNYALAGNFTYYMDERDKEWLEKNNETARGEGTSAQGVLSASNSATRTSARGSKVKGKEPEISSTLPISEDEFELVMGIFEKVTHERTEFLHHSLETGMTFPAFSDYQDTFSNSLTPGTFASYSVPLWLPNPSHLVRVARLIYPHWKERRIERGGHRIIPILNYDEADTLNESYVCFRRREIKTIRKTRASQATMSDKLVRLQAELAYPLDLGKRLLQREHFKNETAQYARQVWDKRILLADFKRKYPGWGDKADDDLLVDKDPPKKVDSSRPSTIKPEGTPIHPEVAMLPTERTALINDATEKILRRQIEQDHDWDDHIDDPYQQPLVPYPERCFKYISASLTISTERRKDRAIRTRIGRGGRLLIDRRDSVNQVLSSRPSAQHTQMVVEDDEQLQRMQERWRYDADDIPVDGPEGQDETNRVLVDDYTPRILRHSMLMLSDRDHHSLNTDPAIPVISDGRQQFVVPYRLEMPILRRLQARSGVPHGYMKPTPVIMNGTPISVQQQMKMPPPMNTPPMRISSNGGMRPTSLAGSVQTPVLLPQSPPNSAVVQRTSPINGMNRAAITLPHVDPSKVDSGIPTVLNGVLPLQDNSRHQDPKLNINSTALMVTQPSGMTIGVSNTYHATTPQVTTAFSSAYSSQLGIPSHGLSLLQMQNLKTAFANVHAQVSQEMKGTGQPLHGHLLAGTTELNLQQQFAAATNSNFNSKMSPLRQQTQWANGAVFANQNPVTNGIDGQTTGPASPPAPQVAHVRVSSAHGLRPGIPAGPGGQLNAHMSPRAQSTSLPISNTLVQSHTPRIPLTSTLPRASPLLQHQQPAGNSKNGY